MVAKYATETNPVAYYATKTKERSQIILDASFVTKIMVADSVVRGLVANPVANKIRSQNLLSNLRRNL